MHRRSRRIAVSVLAWVLCAASSILMFGLVDLGTTLGLSDPSYRWPMSLEASWGSMFTFLIGGGFAWIGARPARSLPGLGLLGIAAFSLLMGSAGLGDPRPLPVVFLLVAFGLIFATALEARPTRVRRSRKFGRSLHSLIAAAGVVLWLAYACVTLLAARSADPESGDVTNGIDHWPVQIALGVAIAAGSAVLCISPELWVTLTFWRWMFALSALAVAWAGLAYPDRAGAMPHAFSEMLILIWGTSIVLARAVPNQLAQGQLPLFLRRAAGED